MKKQFYSIIALATIFLALMLFVSCETKEENKVVRLESLLQEMISFEETARFPSPYFSTCQMSSYDRKSVSPDSLGWFANDDGFGIVRIDTIDNRIEKVMFNQEGPGAITRIWITTLDKRGTWRFYFDNAITPGWIIPSYDLMKFGIPELGLGLLQPHTSYSEEGKGGNTLFLPIPYSKHCKITFEDEKGVEPTPKYYHINYRKYEEGTKVETFSNEVVERAKEVILKTDRSLQNPTAVKADTVLEMRQNISSGELLEVELPKGENIINYIQFDVEDLDSLEYAQVMRNIIFRINFDGKQTIWVPLGDFSGGGYGAPPVESWFLTSNGKGKVISRWPMPYKSGGVINLENTSEKAIQVKIKVGVSEQKWDDRSLYFHVSWKQERKLPLSPVPTNDSIARDWNFVNLEGRGVYKGDVLTLFNHSPLWYGEGDEKIWVDKDTFPSHFGTGTEDYYNSSWAPVVPFHTPFGGAPRADFESSHGYNTFFRTRNLDAIPFTEKLIFDIELLSWRPGTVDYATTVYWYGDFNSEANGTSGLEEAVLKLLPKDE